MALSILVGTGLACNAALGAQPFVPLLQPGDAVPSLPLVTQSGQRFSVADLRGNAVAVAFIYTRCRDARMCPLVSAKFARAQHAIGSAPIRLLLVTLDPAYDTPQILARYGHNLGQVPRYLTLATGSAAVINELAGRLDIATAFTPAGAFAHTEALSIITPDGRLARTVDGNTWSAAELIAYARAALPGTTDRFGDLRAWLSAAVERCGGRAPALDGMQMLALFAFSGATIGGAFWLAFRVQSTRDGSHRS